MSAEASMLAAARAVSMLASSTALGGAPGRGRTATLAVARCGRIVADRAREDEGTKGRKTVTIKGAATTTAAIPQTSEMSESTGALARAVDDPRRNRRSVHLRSHGSIVAY